MATGGPEIRHRGPNRRIVLVRMRIDVSRVRDLTLRRRVHAVDLRACESLEGRETERLAERVDARVL
jgi:hypothetical protein